MAATEIFGVLAKGLKHFKLPVSSCKYLYNDAVRDISVRTEHADGRRRQGPG